MLLFEVSEACTPTVCAPVRATRTHVSATVPSSSLVSPMKSSRLQASKTGHVVNLEGSGHEGTGHSGDHASCLRPTLLFVCSVCTLQWLRRSSFLEQHLSNTYKYTAAEHEARAACTTQDTIRNVKDLLSIPEIPWFIQPSFSRFSSLYKCYLQWHLLCWSCSHSEGSLRRAMVRGTSSQCIVSKPRVTLCSCQKHHLLISLESGIQQRSAHGYLRFEQYFACRTAIRVFRSVGSRHSCRLLQCSFAPASYLNIVRAIRE